MSTAGTMAAALLVTGEQLIVQGLEPGPHSVRIALADPTHRVIDSRAVHLEISPRAAAR